MRIIVIIYIYIYIKIEHSVEISFGNSKTQKTISVVRLLQSYYSSGETQSLKQISH